MKSTRSVLVLVVAVAAGGAAVTFASRALQQAGTRPGGQIAVATVDVGMGSKLAPEMLKMVAWPAGAEPAGAFSTAATLDGRVVKTSLVKGEPILDGKLAPAGTQGGLSAVVAEGKRAMTVRVNDVVGVAGFALPGNFVDIMVNTKSDRTKTDRDNEISKIVLERILVLAIAQETGRDETKPQVVNAVTLEVTPEQAENLDLARSVGTLSLVLRNQTDVRDAATEGGTRTTMLKEKAVLAAPAPVVQRVAKPHVILVQAPAAPMPPANTNCIEVVRGTEKTESCF